MNNFKRISAVILALCTAATVFYSCGKNDETTDVSSTETANEIVETLTEKETVEVKVTDEKGNVSVSVSEKIITIPVTKKETTSEKGKNDAVSTQKNDTGKTVADKITSSVTKVDSVITAATTKPAAKTTNPAAKTTKAPVKTTVATTKKPVVNDTINEKAVGIFMLSKSDPVSVGNHATIIVQGTPGKTYSIEFYETPTSTAKLENKKADANGFVSWSFEIRKSCNLGKRKVVVKENNSDNYLETSITIK